ncbi:MAG: lytic transglycosylase domain-containing protein, partial [Candidatus Obscuribacterales bacterium]|nr:lytic transglycosylase domain-containing protein [Steroidobacteraceae bacterium]
MQTVILVVSVAAVWLLVNWTYQVIRKPSELFFPVSGMLYKSPAETWRQYAPLFRKHATGVITADFLAALAQTEGSGNPVVRTYWRWSLTAKPLEMYRPASSAVGMYQITDGTFAEAKRFCIHAHVVVESGPWHNPRSCWFNSLYTRVVPSHAVELTSAYLDRHVAAILAQTGTTSATLRQKQDLAAVIHLCGAGAGARYARRGLRFTPNQR